MITFLPYQDYAQSAKCLDRQRLGKQRVETLQILQALLGLNKTSRWRHHPASRMWRGYEYQLCLYGQAMSEEWISRGYRDNLLPMFKRLANALVKKDRNQSVPPWLDDELCSNHRANLIRKNADHYSQFGWTESPTEGYIWPDRAKPPPDRTYQDGFVCGTKVAKDFIIAHGLVLATTNARDLVTIDSDGTKIPDWDRGYTAGYVAAVRDAGGLV